MLHSKFDDESVLHKSESNLSILCNSYTHNLLGFIQIFGVDSNIRVVGDILEFRASPKVFDKFLFFLKTHLAIKAGTLIDIICYENPHSVVDNNGDMPNTTVATNISKLKAGGARDGIMYTIIYNLLSLVFNTRVNVYLEISDKNYLSSVVSVYPNAN